MPRLGASPRCNSRLHRLAVLLASTAQGRRRLPSHSPPGLLPGQPPVHHHRRRHRIRHHHDTARHRPARHGRPARRPRRHPGHPLPARTRHHPDRPAALPRPRGSGQGRKSLRASCATQSEPAGPLTRGPAARNRIKGRTDRSPLRHAAPFEILKVSGANETGEPNGEPAPTDTRPRQRPLFRSLR
jgi:hypothetical protein